MFSATQSTGNQLQQALFAMKAFDRHFDNQLEIPKRTKDFI